MATLRLQIEIQKGVRGVPLEKLSHLVGDVEEFLRMLSEDIGIGANPGSWVGLDFEDGSLTFVAEKSEPVVAEKISDFNAAFLSIVEKRPVPELRRATVAQYAKIADPIGAEEAVSFSLYDPAPDNQPPLLDEDPEEVSVSHLAPTETAPLRKFELTKAEALAIQAEVQANVRAYGALQGRIHSLFLGSTPAYFNLRELSTGSLVRCVFKAEVYPYIAAALQRRNAVLHVYGYTTTDLVQRKMEEMDVKRIDLAPVLEESDLDKLFGCSPRFTGNLTTQEFIDFARGRGN